MLTASSAYKTACDDPQRVTQKHIIFDGTVEGDLADALIGYWKFEEASWNGTASEVVDSSGNGNHGAAVGGATTTAAGKIGRGGSFDGSNDGVNLGNAAALQISTGSLAIWINIPVAGAGASYRALMAKDTAYGLFLQDNELGIYDWIAGVWRATGEYLNDGLDHHVGLSFQSGVTNGTIIYIDGLPVLTTTMTVNSQTSPLGIFITGVNYPAKGMGDEAALFNRVLTPAEFLFLANGYDYRRDISAKLDDLGTISLRQYEGDDVTANPLSVTVINDDKAFNAIRTNKPGNFGKAGIVSLGHDNEFVDMFKGYLDDCEYEISDRHRAILTYKHKLQACVETTVGSAAYPVAYAAQNPADLVWSLATVKGGLDDTVSTANTDIDYTTWLEYWTICDQLGISLEANFTGRSIAEAFRVIGLITDAVIYPDPSGKIFCKKFIPRDNSDPYLFTDATGDIQATRFFMNRARVLNKLKVWYGYDTATSAWDGSVLKENATSQTNYGTLGREFDDTGIWHATLASATAVADRMVARYTDPPDTIEISFRPGTQAPLHQIGDIPQVTCAEHDLTAQSMQVYGIEHTLMTGEGKLLLESIGTMNQDYFVLDSTSNGVMDINILY